MSNAANAWVIATRPAAPPATALSIAGAEPDRFEREPRELGGDDGGKREMASLSRAPPYPHTLLD